MMVHFCDGGITCRREAEDVNANPSCEITGSGGTEESFADIQAPLAFRRAVQSVTDTQSSAARGSSATPIAQ